MAESKPRKASAKKHPPRQRIDSVVGRLTYVPSWARAGAVDGVGSLQRTRGTAETPRFQQLSPFAEWCPPTLVPDPPPPAVTAPTKVVKAVKRSLRRRYPEIGFIDNEAEEIVLDEIYAATHPPGHPSPTASNHLLAVGDVSDLSVSSSNAHGHRAVAHAAGESGHILRLVKLVKEEWTWEDSGHVRVGLGTLDHDVSIEWYQDVLPISAIKFATDNRKWAPLRWLIVQKAASTTLLEPEVGRVATFDAASRSGRTLQRSSRVSANPLFTIRASETGGRAQTGVSFKPVVDGKPPQLAIIDECGSWSVWNITGRRSERPKKLSPVRVLCGHILTGSLYALPEKGASASEPHSILWRTLDRRAAKARRQQEEGEDGQDEHPTAASSEPVAEKESKTHVLLICNRLGLYLYDAQANRSQNFTHVVTSYTGQLVLDVKPSPLHSSQAFVLTSTTLSWVSVAEDTDGGSNSVSLLASCPHKRNIRDPGLRLDISPAAYINQQKACFACIRSEKDAQITIIWFINPTSGSPVQHRREIISLNNMPSFTSMSLLPASRRVQDDSERSSGQVAMSEARFFQVLALSEELGLGSTLCVWSDFPDVRIPPPDKLVRSAPVSEAWRERKALRKLLENRFVVPDCLDENPGQDPQDTSAVMNTNPMVRAPRTKNFPLLGELLPVHEEYLQARHHRKVEETASVDHIDDAVRELKVGDWMPLRPLLDLVGPDKSLFNLLRMFMVWDMLTSGALEHKGEWRAVSLVGRGLSEPSLNELFDKFAELFPKGVHQRPKSLMQRIVFETFLSETYIASGPQAPRATLPPIPSSSLMDFTYRSSPPVFFSQELPSLPRSTQDSQHDEPPPGLVVREFAPIRPVLPDEGAHTELLSHWKLGSDAKTVDWDPIEEAEDRAHRLRLQRKLERRRQRAEKKRTLAEEMGLRSVAAARAATTSQASVPIILASERPVVSSSSQWPTIQVAPTISMSQVVPGAYGGRTVKRAPKRKAGFR